MLLPLLRKAYNKGTKLRSCFNGAPRLLAHALLFEVDYLLKKRTQNNFVRWMDDINFGVAEPT